MTTSPRRYNDTIVAALRTAITDGSFGLSDVPGLLKRVICEEMWREREIAQTGEMVRFNRFVDFVREKPLEGLGTSVEQLQRLCNGDPEVLDLIDQTLQLAFPNGGRHSSDRINIVNSDYGERYHPEGNSRAYALRRLRKNRPDLHARVLAGELSPHAAMVTAGFRQRRLTIPLDVSKVAAVIVRVFTPDQIADLIQLLRE